MTNMGLGLIILESFTAVGLIIAAFYFTVSYRRFVKGEFSDIVKWVVYSVVFLTIFILIRDAGGLIPAVEELFLYVAHIASLVAILCLLKAAILLDRFSQVYGFAEAEEEFARIFISGADEEK